MSSAEDGKESVIDHVSQTLQSVQSPAVTLSQCRDLFGPGAADRFPHTRQAIQNAFASREAMSPSELVRQCMMNLDRDALKQKGSDTKHKICDAETAFRVLAELKVSMAATMKSIEKAQETSRRTGKILAQTQEALETKMEVARQSIERATNNLAAVMIPGSRRPFKHARLEKIHEEEGKENTGKSYGNQDSDMAGGSSKQNPSHVKKKRMQPRTSSVGWIKPTALQRKRAVLAKLQEAQHIPSAFQDAPMGAFKAIQFPNSGDWLDDHKERGQTFREFCISTQGTKPISLKRVIELVPIGIFGEDVSLPLFCRRSGARCMSLNRF